MDENENVEEVGRKPEEEVEHEESESDNQPI